MNAIAIRRICFPLLRTMFSEPVTYRESTRRLKQPPTPPNPSSKLQAACTSLPDYRLDAVSERWSIHGLVGGQATKFVFRPGFGIRGSAALRTEIFSATFFLGGLGATCAVFGFVFAFAFATLAFFFLLTLTTAGLLRGLTGFASGAVSAAVAARHSSRSPDKPGAHEFGPPREAESCPPGTAAAGSITEVAGCSCSCRCKDSRTPLHSHSDRICWRWSLRGWSPVALRLSSSAPYHQHRLASVVVPDFSSSVHLAGQYSSSAENSFADALAASLLSKCLEGELEESKADAVSASPQQSNASDEQSSDSRQMSHIWSEIRYPQGRSRAIAAFIH